MKQNYLLLLPIILLVAASSCKKQDATMIAIEELVVQPQMELADTINLAGEWLEGTIHNNTNVSMVFGEEYKLNYKEAGEWKQVLPNGDNIGFNSLAYGLPANGENQFRIYLHKSLYDYKDGEYRLDKNLMLTMTAEFNVVKGIIAEQQESSKERMEGLNFDLYATHDTISTETDSIQLWFRNNSDVYVYAFDHYFIEQYVEIEDRWLNVNRANYTGKHEKEILPNSTFCFDIPSKALKMKEGRYRIRKDFEMPVSAEFVLTY